MKLDCFASQTHLVDHCAPIWNGLDRSERGEFVVVGRDAMARAQHHGIAPRVGRVRRSRNRIIIASWGDVPAVGGRRFIMTEHGAAQSYGGEPHPDCLPDYGHTCNLDLIVVPNAACAFRNSLHHHHAAIEIASPRVERLVSVRNESVRTDPPTVAFAWHWAAPGPSQEALWAWPYWREAVAKLAVMGDAERGYRIIGTAHPKAARHLHHWYRRNGIEYVADSEDVIRRADVVVFDATSFGWEAAATGIPVVLLDAPWYRPNVNHGLRWWTHAGAGLRVGSGAADELHAAIVRTLAEDPYADARRTAVDAIYGSVAGSLERSLAAIRALD